MLYKTVIIRDIGFTYSANSHKLCELRLYACYFHFNVEANQSEWILNIINNLTRFCVLILCLPQYLRVKKL